MFEVNLSLFSLSIYISSLPFQVHLLRQKLVGRRILWFPIYLHRLQRYRFPTFLCSRLQSQRLLFTFLISVVPNLHISLLEQTSKSRILLEISSSCLLFDHAQQSQMRSDCANRVLKARSKSTIEDLIR